MLLQDNLEILFTKTNSHNNWLDQAVSNEQLQQFNKDYHNYNKLFISKTNIY